MYWTHSGATHYLTSFASGDMDSLKSTSSAPGPMQTITYASISETLAAPVYIADAVPSVPVLTKLDVKSPTKVVSKVDTEITPGNVLSASYQYGGLKADVVAGRGGLGFRWMKTKNLANNLETYTEVSQAWPHTGENLLTETRLAGSGNAGVLKRTSTTLACKIPYSGAACTGAVGSLTYGYPSQTIEDTWDLNGALMSSITTLITMANDPVDGKFYGDIGQATATSSDGFQKVTQHTYWPADTANWRLGRVKNTTVTSTQP